MGGIPKAEFDRFVDELMPDDESLLTVDDIAQLIVKVRAFIDQYDVADEQKAEFATRLLQPVFRAAELTPVERQEIMNKWAAAFGVEIDFLH